MKAQWKFGLRTVAMLAGTALIGFGQAPTGATGQVGVPQDATYTRTDLPKGANPQTRKTVYPGAVNYVEGNATLNGEPFTRNAVGSAVVGPNEVIATTDGYAEVLLTPGAFLRIGHNSEAQFVSAGLTGVNVELTQGSAMVEAADLVKGTTLDLTVHSVPVQIEKKGLYSFNATEGAIRVLDGKADVQQAERSVTLKKRDELALNGEAKKHDFDLKAEEKQPLYVWSKVRSQDEAQANLHTANLIVAGGSWYGPGWYWDPLWASYAFMPGAGIMYSPFGWGYYSPAFYGYWGGPAIYPRYGYYRGFAAGHVAGVGAIHSATGFRAGSGFHAASGFHGGRR